ncbi:MAG: hypothetical protein R3B09_27535 [Nannocystaceae bacterium]
MNLRIVGQVLMWIGVIAAALVSVRVADAIAWPHYAGALGLGALGVVLIRRGARQGADAHAQIAEGLATLRSSLALVLRGVDELVAAGESIDVYAVKDRIDRDLADALARFADARESMIPAFGLDAYAEIMSAFASGERMLNRAWSASADGYLDEVQTCLQRAHALLHGAQARLERASEDRRAPRLSL